MRSVSWLFGTNAGTEADRLNFDSISDGDVWERFDMITDFPLSGQGKSILDVGDLGKDPMFGAGSGGGVP